MLDEGDDDDDVPAFFSRRVSTVTTTTTTTAAAVRRPVRVAPQKRAPVPKRATEMPMPASLQFENDEIAPETVEKLSTFDKGSKSNASLAQRLNVLDSRVRRSKEKVASAPPVSLATATVDDSLLVDAIGSTARDYERHTYYKGSTRVIDFDDGGGGSKGKKREKEEDADEEQEDDDEDDDVMPMDIDHDDIYMEAAEDGDGEESEIHHRTMLVPVPVMHAVPETGNTRMVSTFSELVGPSPATKQFESNMRHVKGPEQHVFVEVRPQEVLYPHVTEKLNEPMKNQQLTRYAIKRGLSIPKLPKVSRAMVKDGLHAPNFSIGERPCVYQERCTSFQMSHKRKAKEPEKYAGAEPFACKEFYFGKPGEKVREAIARGLPLHEVLNPDPVMCVMCHMAVVTRFYKRYSIGLEIDPPHILHSFEMDCEAEGEYSVNAMLLGDDKFMGIIGRFVRFCPDNYEWYPQSPTIVEEVDPLTGMVQKMSQMAIQCWTELPRLDFPEGAV